MATKLQQVLDALQADDWEDDVDAEPEIRRANKGNKLLLRELKRREKEIRNGVDSIAIKRPPFAPLLRAAIDRWGLQGCVFLGKPPMPGDSTDGMTKVPGE